MTKTIPGTIIIIALIFTVSLIYFSFMSVEPSEVVTTINLGYDLEGTRITFPDESKYFEKYSFQEDFNGEHFDFVWYLAKPELSLFYSELRPDDNAIVIVPIFTSSAYWEPGFYNFYRGECFECITVPIRHDLPLAFHSSHAAVQIFSILGYDYITDIEVDKNPEILKKYDKVILLHNEYVTQKEFDAITNHPKVVYLYPNSLYAQIEVDYEKNTLSLIRGHGYPEKEIDNGFDWKFDNTRPYEFDTNCINWKFYEINNGLMLNCYPENILHQKIDILKKIKEF